MPASKKVISVGTLAELLWLRHAVLRGAGFDVLTTLDVKNAVATIQGGRGCSILLLCYSLPLLTRKRLAESFRASCPQGRIVSITNERSEPEFADVVVYGLDGPEALIEAIRDA